MKYAHISRDGTLSHEIEADGPCLTVTKAGKDVVNEDDWFEYIDDFIYGPVRRNGDGLTYRMCIEVMNWWDAGGEGISEYEIEIDMEDPGATKETVLELEGKRSRDRDELEELLANAGFESPDTHIREEEITTLCVSLRVVPVSVTKEKILDVSGMGDHDSNFVRGVEECIQKHGDCRDYAYDMSSYGCYVPIRVKYGGKVDFGHMVTEDELEDCIKACKEQAYAVIGLFGFYMDQQVNALGECGWDWLRRYEAFPGQQQDYGSGYITEDEDGNPIKCYDCGDEKPCILKRTTYTCAEGEYFCADCLEGYYICSGEDCDMLIPIEPQSYAGVEWTKIDQGHYCEDCASKYFDQDDVGAVKGGTVLTAEDVRDQSKQLHMAHLETWDKVDDWEVGWSDRSVDEDKVARDIRFAIKKASPKKEFIFGVNEHSQFYAMVALYVRTAR